MQHIGRCSVSIYRLNPHWSKLKFRMGAPPRSGSVFPLLSEFSACVPVVCGVPKMCLAPGACWGHRDQRQQPLPRGLGWGRGLCVASEENRVPTHARAPWRGWAPVGRSGRPHTRGGPAFVSETEAAEWASPLQAGRSLPGAVTLSVPGV